MKLATPFDTPAAIGPWRSGSASCLRPTSARNWGVLLVVIGLAMGALGLAKMGILVFSGFVLFTLVTLPVEIDASVRARTVLAQAGWLTPAELDGVGRVLRAVLRERILARESRTTSPV
jgi:Zn-dependent membrane protease YugP